MAEQKKENVYLKHLRGIVLEGLGINDSDGKRDDWNTAIQKYAAAHNLRAGLTDAENEQMIKEFKAYIKGKAFNDFGDEAVQK